LVPVVLSIWPERGVELVKTLRLGAAIFGQLPCIKRTAKICSALIAAVFLLQFYCVRELLFAEVVVALGFVVVAVIFAVYALGCIAVLWLRNVACRLKALGALVTARHQQPFAKTTAAALSEAKEEVS
jgi:phosphotransferase system  glucose/maltose/N-acetylglucosamine-specific IIC component